MTTNRPFPIDATQTAIAIGYKNKNLIHAMALPALPVASETFKWLEYPVAEAFTLPAMEVGRKSRPALVEFTAEERESHTKDYGLDDAIPNSDIREAAKGRERGINFNPIENATEGLTHLIQLGREVRTAAIVQDANSYTVGRMITLAGAEKFSDDTSDPFSVIEEGMRKPLIYRANTIVMGQDVWAVTRKHPRMLKAVKGGLAEDGAITRAQFAELMEVDLASLLIGMGQVNLAAKGLPINLQNVWGNSIQLLYLDSQKRTSSDSVLTWGFTAECGTKISGTIPDPDIGVEGGQRVRVAEKVREIVCAKDLGYQIRAVI